MSVGIRIARHGQAKLRTNLSSAPHEPLLFLYPAWARNSSTAIAQPLSFFSQPSVESLPPADFVPRNTGQKHVVASAEPSTVVRRARPKTLDGQYDSESKTQKSPTQVARKKPPEEIEALDVKHKIRRIEARTARTKKVQEWTAENRQIWQTYRNESLGRTWDSDWRIVLRELTSSTPRHGKWLDGPITLEVPVDSARLLMNGLDEDIWVIANMHDCAVRLGARKEGESVCRTFVLSGSPVAISRTAAHVLRIAPGVQIKKVGSLTEMADTTDAETGMQTKAAEYECRNVIARQSRKIRVQADRVTPRAPERWNRESFYDYICDLTRNDQLNHFQTSKVTSILRELFGAPVHKTHITNMAIREAMSYYMKTNNVGEQRWLFNEHTVTDPEIFNIMLRLPAQNKDLHNFHYILNLMTRKGLRPNKATWLLFLDANSNSLEIQLSILQAMKTRGLTQDVPAIRDFSGILVIPHLELILDFSGPRVDFMKELNSRFSRDWLTLNTANRILNLLGSRGLLARCCEFLKVMDSHFLKPDTSSINTILHHCKQAKTLEGALEMLRFIPTNNNFTPDRETFQTLFDMAWHSRSYNVSRVVWQYACFTSNASSRIRRLVQFSLRDEKSDLSSVSPRERFHALAGKFLIAHPKPVARPDVVPAQTLLIEKSAEEVSQSKEPAKQEWASFASGLVMMDMRVLGDCEPVHSFISTLWDAFEMDRAWKKVESETRTKKELRAMLEEGVIVQMKSKASCRATLE